MKIVYTDVLVIGGGLAGLRMAVAAKRRGHDSIVLSLVPPKRSHSKAAQGGMQASLANVIKGVGDNEDVHFADTVRGSDWGADQDVVRMFVNTSPKAVRELAAWGVPWSRITPGDRQVIINGEKVTITERKEAAGLIGQRERIDDLVQIAVEHLIKLIERQADAVIGHAVLREVVGAYLFAAVTAADLALAAGVVFLVVGVLLLLQKTAAQDL